jgi:uncharacterized protein YggU (UPF0235/DUF167 family)
MSGGTPFTAFAGGVRVAIRLSPRAGANRIAGVAEDAEGRFVLRASVTAVPEKGKANTALIALLAKEWDLPRTSFEIAGGATDRRKIVEIAGDPQGLMRKLVEWMRKHHG